MSQITKTFTTQTETLSKMLTDAFSSMALQTPAQDSETTPVPEAFEDQCQTPVPKPSSSPASKFAHASHFSLVFQPINLEQNKLWRRRMARNLSVASA